MYHITGDKSLAHGLELGALVSGKGNSREKERLGMGTGMWISHTKRLLKSLAVEIRSPGLNSSNGDSIGTIVSLLPRACGSG